MPDLLHSLRNSDIGYLRIVAGLWGVELTASETDEALKELAASLQTPGLVGEVVAALPAEARSALAALVEAGGKIPWATFARRFGEIRQAGPGRRDRERIYLNPVSAAEVLYYRALLLRAFYDTPNGPQEFAYIPDDLFELVKGLEASLTPTPSPDGRGVGVRANALPLGERAEVSVIPTTAPVGDGSGVRDTPLPVEDGSGVRDTPLPVGEGQGVRDSSLGRPATPKERAHPILAGDRLLDDATTFLAAQRMGFRPPEMPTPVEVVEGFLAAAGILVKGVPQPERLKSFLEMLRPQALDLLAEAWQESDGFNELRLFPGLICEGEWQNQPLETRRTILGLLASIPKERWWSLPAFTFAIKEKSPDFQRPVGDYDSWFIKRASDGSYLRGFASWDEVDGALIRYFVTVPLFWLGWADLATPADSETITAFRLREKRPTSSEEGKLTVASNGRISVPRSLRRAARYQIARFCEWEEEKPEEYRYRVSIRSLEKAGQQGLKVAQLLPLLAKNAAVDIPPAFVKALKRWEAKGTEARVETQTILRVTRPEVLEELRKSKAGRFLGESLGPVAAVVKPGAQSKVLAALAELGLLAEDVTQSRD